MKYSLPSLVAVLLSGIVAAPHATAQCLLGADLSYANEVGDAGGVYRDTEGNEVDVYRYFADRGADMVRLRLWYTPGNIPASCGGQITSSSLADVLRGARRAHDANMQVKLAIHYSDYFVDPGKQERPAAWAGLSGQVLSDSIFNYTLAVLGALRAQGTVPAIVAVGNETDNGFIDEGAPTDGFEWPADAAKFNAGLAAVDTFNARFGESCTKAIHLTERYARFGAAEFTRNGITNFDMFGLSYYPKFDPETTIEEFGDLVEHLVTTYDKQVIVAETGFAWTRTGFADDYNNFLSSNGNVVTQPTSREGQRDFLIALTREVFARGGTGVLYWEPAWVTSDMCDRWGRGSSYESATFFDFENDNRALPAFDFLDCASVLSFRENQPARQTVTVYPNPYQSNRLHLELADGERVNAWKLYGAAGELIDSSAAAVEGNFIDLEPWGDGFRFLSLELASGQTVTVRILATHHE